MSQREYYTDKRVSNVAFESSMLSIKKDSSNNITAFTNNYNINYAQTFDYGTGETS